MIKLDREDWLAILSMIPVMILNQWLDDHGYREYIWTPIAAAAVIAVFGLIRGRFTARRLWTIPVVMVFLGLFIYLLD